MNLRLQSLIVLNFCIRVFCSVFRIPVDFFFKFFQFLSQAQSPESLWPFKLCSSQSTVLEIVGESS